MHHEADEISQCHTSLGQVMNWLKWYSSKIKNVVVPILGNRMFIICQLQIVNWIQNRKGTTTSTMYQVYSAAKLQYPTVHGHCCHRLLAPVPENVSQKNIQRCCCMSPVSSQTMQAYSLLSCCCVQRTLGGGKLSTTGWWLLENWGMEEQGGWLKEGWQAVPEDVLVIEWQQKKKLAHLRYMFNPKPCINC